VQVACTADALSPRAIALRRATAAAPLNLLIRQ